MTTREIGKVKLSERVTVAEYLKLEKNKDQKGIAKFIQDRFTERYIEPLRGCNTHGFSIMAVSCLMIEALESFRQGWPDTDGKGKSKRASRSFSKSVLAEKFL